MIDISGITISQAASALSINTGANPMSLLATGAVKRPGQTMFVAIDIGTGWVYFADGVWTKIPLKNTGSSPNIGSCFDFVNSRFTAPVTGTYWFAGSTYIYKDNGSVGHYWHPIFYLNGSVNSPLSGAPMYRLRGHGILGTSCEFDGQIDAMFELNAGDYVEYWHYATGAGGNRWYNHYSRFAGGLIG